MVEVLGDGTTTARHCASSVGVVLDEGGPGIPRMPGPWLVPRAPAQRKAPALEGATPGLEYEAWGGKAS